MDSRGAAHAIGALKGKRLYHISQNALLFDLSLPSKDLKFITVNLLSKNLKLIDLQNNKIEALPEEVADLTFLEKLKIDNNLIKVLPSKIGRLQMLQTLTACNNQLSMLPPAFEELFRLEILLLNDNRISSLPAKIGGL